MIKNIILFLLSVLTGIILIIGYERLIADKNVFHRNKPVANTQFSLERAPAKSLTGTISSFSGDVNWQSRTASQAAKLIASQTIQQGEEITTGVNGKITLEFPNIATISASANTDLNIIQTLPANIVIDQSKGFANYAADGTTPLSVRSLNLLTNITGGIVNISVDKNQHIVTVDVQKGSGTEGFNDSQNKSNVITIDEGSQFIYNADTKNGVVK
jgi:hypothetical protein